ncbi:MAG TPA: hypothetical protein VMA98_07520 [Candidatus Acidoferrales bacterium]|nr:hypothetical protein [Candidatus Acidoferrales bacterium]
MKLPYRAGDSFALPLGNGTTAPATILATHHHVVDIAVAGLMLRVFDSALVLHRWKRSRDVTPPAPSPPPPRAWDERWPIGPAHAERIVATQLGVADVELPPLFVRGAHPPPEFPSSARYVRIAQRGLELDPRELGTRFPALESLDCSHVRLRSLDFPSTLRALRLAWVPTPIDLRVLAKLPLHTLALEEPRELRGTGALMAWPSLRQLEMLGCWQLTLGEMMPLAESPRLLRVTTDIGGRRKNVELYRRASWAYPWPFELFALRPGATTPAATPARNG